MYHVVGGGIAGLAAAYRLQQRGHEVQVLEASTDLGGLAATYETAGDPIEKFYHHLSKSEKTIVEFAEELGVGDALEWRIGKNAYYVDGVVHPMDKPWEILAFPYWSLYDKFRLGMLTLDVDVRGGRPTFDTYENLADFEDQTAVEFAKEHTTENVYETFFDPLLEAKFGDRKNDVSAAWLLGRIKFRGERDLLKGEKLGYFDGSFAVFIDALVDAVGRENVTTGARVTDLAFGDSVESITYQVADDARAETSPGEVADGGTTTTTEPTDGVVVATMPNVLEDLTGYACDVDFQGAVCAVVTMEQSITDTYWLNVADEAPFGALIEHTNFVPPARYGGDHLLYIASYVQSEDEWLATADADEIETRWLDAVADLFPQFDPDSVSDFRLAKSPRAAPIYECGYLDLVVPYDLADEVTEGLYYAGMASPAQYPERSLNGGVVAGFECADRIDRKSN
jgi:protoporphyrinogen oxidase